jgi:cytochrome c-type biogenesis protein CcsB
MIDRILRELFSMRMMALGLLIFLIAIAMATFIESDYGTPASKIAVYNALWFEILLIYLSMSLIANIFRYKMYQREKAALFAFHLSFLVIIIGAALTRYVGFEGQMRIKEGQTTNIIFSSSPYLSIKANDGKNQFTYLEQRWLSEGVENPFSVDFQLPNQPEFTLEYVSYKENMIDSIVQADSLEGEALEFVIRGKSQYLFKNDQRPIGDLNFAFEKEGAIPGVQIWEKNGQLFIQSIEPFQRVDMMKLSREDRMKNQLDESQVVKIPADTAVRFFSSQLYMFPGESIMFREYKQNIAKIQMRAEEKNQGEDLLTLRLKSEGNEQLVTFSGGPQVIMGDNMTQFAGLNFQLGYGAKPIEVPFSIKCREFQLDRYPGSDMASSYASEVTLTDTVDNYKRDQRIFMNNVMDYKGYRFFQSSYFPDESGTILSVNYDWWGTNVSYLGYLLMTIGMILSLVNSKGRMSDLNKLIKKSRDNRNKMIKVLILMLMVVGFTSNGFAHQADTSHNHEHNQEDSHDHDHSHDHNHDHEHDHNQSSSAASFETPKVELKYITVEQSEKIADLLVQDYEGRVIPFHTLADRVMRKVHRSDEYEGKNAVQVMMAFHLYGPEVWLDKKLVYVSSKIRGELGVGKYVSLQEMEDETGNFKWYDDYQKAHEKKDANKNEYDKKLLKLGERYRILKEVFAYRRLRIVPVPGDQGGNWVWPYAQELRDKDQTGNDLASQFLRTTYAVTQGNASFAKVEQFLVPLKTLQWESVDEYRKINPSADLPTKPQVNAEILYNQLKLFGKVQYGYLLIGLVLLIIFFFRVVMTPTLEKESFFNKISKIFFWITLVVFVAHGFGLGVRWYVTGYVPWSKGYEALVFISWATVLIGLFFTKKNPAVLGATALSASLFLLVTELNLLDPEISSIQPVLKSYWLMIHVAIITASYGALGIGALLGLVNLLLYLFKNKSNKKRLQMNIVEITSVSEMVTTIGLFMLTIGTFLGGIWANESWGRYWGWDPKETWALVSVLTYAIILHLRFIPGLNGKFAFNVFNLWGFSSIIFTFFGVNFILVGLHSYAQGEGVATMPTWAWTTIIIFALLTLASMVKHIMDSKSKKA